MHEDKIAYFFSMRKLSIMLLYSTALIKLLFEAPLPPAVLSAPSSSCAPPTSTIAHRPLAPSVNTNVREPPHFFVSALQAPLLALLERIAPELILAVTLKEFSKSGHLELDNSAYHSNWKQSWRSSLRKTIKSEAVQYGCFAHPFVWMTVGVWRLYKLVRTLFAMYHQRTVVCTYRVARGLPQQGCSRSAMQACLEVLPTVLLWVTHQVCYQAYHRIAKVARQPAGGHANIITSPHTCRRMRALSGT